jgi:ATP-binding cassette subfamily B protein
MALQVVLVRDLVAELGEASATGTVAGLLLPLGAVVALTALVLTLDQLRVDQQRVLGEEASLLASRTILDVLTGVPLIRFDDPAFHDRAVRAQMDVVTRPAQMVFALLTVVSTGVSLVGIVAVLCTISPVFVALVGTGAVPLIAAVVVLARATYGFEVGQTPRDRARQYLFFLLAGRPSAAEVRAFGAARALGERYEAMYLERVQGLRQLARRRAVPAAAGLLLSTVTIGLAVVVLAGEVAAGQVDVGAAVAAIGGLFLLSTRLPGLAASIGTLVESALFLDDVEQLCGEPHPPMTGGLPAPDERGAPTRPGRLVIENVSFRYPGRPTDAVRNVSLAVEPGEVVALVGENGSGKSTLVNLVAGLLQPAAGSVTWDGARAADLGAAEWARRFAIVFQDHVRYHLPATDVIALGEPDAPLDVARLHRAARRSGIAAELERLPLGYATPLGPEFLGGTDLSGGQWQRLALARALYRPAPFLILDEPTAALDPAAEAAWFGGLRDLLDGRSALVVSHRLSTVRSADRIYVLHEGRVTEHGSHEELVTLGTAYARLFEQQAASFGTAALR